MAKKKAKQAKRAASSGRKGKASASARKGRRRRAKRRKVLMLIGGRYHPHEEVVTRVERLIERWGGRWELTATGDFDVLAGLASSDYEAVLVYATGHRDELTAERERGLVRFVKGGGGLVGIHSAADTFRGSRAYIEMLNAEFQTHPRFTEFPVRIVDRDHYLTARMPDFTTADELYVLQSHDPGRSRLLAETVWQGRRMPLAFTHTYGQGRVAYVALGHNLRSWNQPEFERLVIRALEWAGGADLETKREVRFGILGYGPSYDMGKRHAECINEQPGMRAVAVCDTQADRLEAARQELGDVRTFGSLEAMLKMKGLDVVVNILPHNLHAETSLECLRAGKGVVCEKPFAITTEESTKMIRAARRAGVLLSVYHNRRWDGDYRAISDVVQRGLLGEVFHVEAFMGGYRRPGTDWRSDKTISGGALYDWGAHFTDWILRLVDKRVAQVTGLFHKRLWQHVTNEDQTEAVIRFEGGEAADLQISSLAAGTKPRWRVLGTLGALTSKERGAHHVTSYASGVKFEGDVPFEPSHSGTPYYRNIADHLLMGEPLEVTAEQAREVIAVIETAERSSAEGRSLPLPREVYEG